MQSRIQSDCNTHGPIADPLWRDPNSTTSYSCCRVLAAVMREMRERSRVEGEACQGLEGRGVKCEMLQLQQVGGRVRVNRVLVSTLGGMHLVSMPCNTTLQQQQKQQQQQRRPAVQGVAQLERRMKESRLECTPVGHVCRELEGKNTDRNNNPMPGCYPTPASEQELFCEGTEGVADWRERGRTRRREMEPDGARWQRESVSVSVNVCEREKKRGWRGWRR
ncbi:hypothetical protein B0O80DRAFT_457325, partial [Mortierella sp. GBAus27b]